MVTANAILGLRPLDSNLLRRPAATWTGEEIGRPVGEAPPSGVTQAGGHNQTVAPLTKGEKSGFSEHDRSLDKQRLSEAVTNMNDFLQRVSRSLEFTLDEDSGRVVVQIKDAETDQVIRQIPPEYMLKLAKELDKLNGLLFQEEA